MKLCIAALLLSPVSAFAPIANRNVGAISTTTSQLHSAVEAEAPVERNAPDAGYVPDWEDREGLSPEEFMKSDMSKPDLSGMWECPLTQWDTDG